MSKDNDGTPDDKWYTPEDKPSTSRGPPVLQPPSPPPSPQPSPLLVPPNLVWHFLECPMHTPFLRGIKRKRSYPAPRKMPEKNPNYRDLKYLMGCSKVKKQIKFDLADIFGDEEPHILPKMILDEEPGNQA